MSTSEIVTYNNLEYNGRLGNQLWQIAWQFGEAERRGTRAWIRPEWSYRPYFSIPDEFYLYPTKTHPEIDGETGYFQELHYFDNVADRVRAYFKPSSRIRRTIKGRWDFATDRSWCSVHVRRGDYLLNPHLFPPATERYYHNAVADVESRVPGINFAVFSDDIGWCMDNYDYFGFPEEDRVHFVKPVVTPVPVEERREPGDYWDMFFMSQMCQEHILSNSTFAWWGAWLSHNLYPIYPNKWFGPEVPGYATHKLAFPALWREFEC
jgi:Glycosyl transferase family 11